MEILTWFFIFALLFFFYICYRYLSLPANIPPGPKGWPLLGFRIRNDDDCAHLTELSRRYGPIFSYFSGTRLIVVLNDVETIREALIKNGERFADRFQFLGERFDQQFGLIASNGEIWREQRRFALHTLRDFGFGKPILENSIVEEVRAIVDEFRATNANPFNPTFLLNCAVSNVVSQLIFGQRHDYKDKEFFDLMDHLNGVVAGGKISFFCAFQWWWMLLPGTGAISGFKYLLKFRDRLNSYFKPIVAQHEKEFDLRAEPRDYIHAFIKAREQGAGKFFHDTQLMQSEIIRGNAVFAAGTETTSTTIRWTILLLATHSHIQDRVYEELADVVGRDRFPQLSDRQNLPFLEAVILEVLRFGCLVALTQRQCIRECNVAGYTIPVGSPVIINLFAAHMDPEKFPDPMKFDPNRFFDAETKKSCNAELLLAFGAGKRVCLGESLARMELFLFIAALFHCFEFRFPDGIFKPRLDHLIGITAQPYPFEILAVPRD